MPKTLSQIFLSLGLFVKTKPVGSGTEYQVGSIDFLPDEVVDRTMIESKTALKRFIKSRNLTLSVLVDDDAFSYVLKVLELNDQDLLKTIQSEFCEVAEIFPEGGVLIPLEDVQSLNSLIEQEKTKLKELFLSGMSVAISEGLISENLNFTEVYKSETDTYSFIFTL